MSATFRLSAKKKVSQDDLRRLMAEQKGKSAKQPKIDNPLAKYNDAGQLMCVLCKSVVRSENVWNVHVNAKQHKENVAEAKRLKELTNNFTSAVKVKNQKRHGDPPSSAPSEKKIKGILKNASAVPQIPVVPHIPKNNAPNIISYHNEEIKRAPLPNLSDAPKVEKPSTSTLADEEVLQPAPEQPIPEGFFDDPILDAKVRNIEYKDPVEEEWEKFQKEIKEEATASAEIIAGEQEEATAERQIEEIDEQIRKWSRVLDIELKKEDIKKKKQDTDQMSEDEDLESDNEADLDEFLDWRAKKAYR
ncbi:zinc finger protein 830 [Plutella xylostella]|uniref:zinc finger protein 830 n=1 Tax=Plutella xylostella TaxID=51655 RepID=UPI0020331A24|nr:zinc finger protein 830 [Plutella xylostella]